MDITEIVDQRLSSILLGVHVCQHCAVVDRDFQRVRVGHRCQTCGTPSPGGLLYFGVAVGALVDLIQEAFHRPRNEPSPAGVGPHHLAVVVFFCTLGEVLLGHFLVECMLAHRLPPAVRARLLADNLSARQRVSRLFRSLTGETWNDAIARVGREHSKDFGRTLTFYREVTRRRNQLLHSGNAWAVAADMPKQCLQRLPILLDLYCALHNAFVHPTYLRDGRTYREHSHA